MKAFLLGAALTIATAMGAAAAEYRIQMLDTGPGGQTMVFEPGFLRIQPGDTVVFVPGSGGHTSETFDDLVPEGGQTWRGRVGEPVTVTLTEPGLYVYRSLPHYGVGMVGLIQVGDSTVNIDEIRSARLPARARERLDAYLEQAAR